MITLELLTNQKQLVWVAGGKWLITDWEIETETEMNIFEIQILSLSLKIAWAGRVEDK